VGCCVDLDIFEGVYYEKNNNNNHNFFNIQPKILLTVDGYYGLSKFSEDKDTEDIGLPNTYHYLNLGLTYKFGK